MTGRSSLGNVSTDIRRAARVLVTASAATAAKTVTGCRRAKTIGLSEEFIVALAPPRVRGGRVTRRLCHDRENRERPGFAGFSWMSRGKCRSETADRSAPADGP